jgi:TANFOR domain-containing protein
MASATFRKDRFPVRYPETSCRESFKTSGQAAGYPASSRAVAFLRRGLAAVILIITALTAALAQELVNQTVQVLPPYTGKLSHYFATPGRIVSIITTNPNNIDAREYRYYLHGYIESVHNDGEIRIGTRRDYRPATPSVMKAQLGPDGGVIAWLPYTLTYSDIQQVFSPQNLEYRGISREQAEKTGLPDGMYRICFMLYINPWGDGFSAQGPFCSPPFSIISDFTAVEAPQIIQPPDNSMLTPEQLQTLQFTWTMPPGAPATTQYRLRIIELNDESANYRDMLRTEAYPAFFETTVTGVPTFLYTIANPPFRPDKAYAFIIRAIDPLGNTNFKNSGFSEVNLFMQAKQTMSSPPPAAPPPTLYIPGQQFTRVTPSIMKPTTIKGRLSYKYPSARPKLFSQGTKPPPLSNARIKLVTYYIVKDSKGRIVENMTREGQKWSNHVNYKGLDDRVVATATTGRDGEFEFNFLSNNSGEPIGITDCSVRVARLENPAADPCELMPGIDQLLAGRGGPRMSGETDNGTDDDVNCRLYLAYRIVIEGEHARYYLDPDQDLKYFFEVKAGETKDVKEVTTLVRSFELKVKATARWSGEEFTIHDKEELQQMDVWIYRKVNFNYPSIFPENDVRPDKSSKFPAPHFPGFTCVGKETTDKNGIASLTDLVLNDNTTYQYYFYINAETYSFETDGLVMLNLKDLIDIENRKNATTTEITDPNTSQTIQLNVTPEDETWDRLLNMRSAHRWGNNRGFLHTEQLDLRFPALVIKLIEPEGLKQINIPAYVTLREEYRAGKLLVENTWKTIRLENDITRFIPMGRIDSSTYELKELSAEFTPLPQEQILSGPRRTVTAKIEGFADETFLVKEEDPLKIGERFEMVIIMRYGAAMRGKVLDAITRKPLAGVKLKVIGEMEMATTTDKEGKYELRARKLDKQRRVEISRSGYMTDTVTVTLNREDNVYNFELFPMARMLEVEVWAGNNWKKGAVVTLPDVPESWTYDFNTGTTKGSSGFLEQAMKQAGQQAAQKTTQQAAQQATQQTAQQTAVQTVQAVSTGTVSTNLNSMAMKLRQPVQKEQITQSMRDKYNMTLSDGLQVSAAISPAYGLQAASSDEGPACSQVTDSDGWAGFCFTGGTGDHFRLVITNDPDADDNYCSIITKVSVPYEKSVMGSRYRFTMPGGGCLSGTVYLGEGTEKPLEGMKVRATVNVDDETYDIVASTDASGRYKLPNLPVNRPFRLTVTSDKGSNNFVGYNNDNYVLEKGGNECQAEDFHMRSVDGVDISSFMGFPFDASGFKKLPGGRMSLTGSITLPANAHFNEQIIDISDVEMVKSSVINTEGDTLLLPAILPFITDINDLTVTLPGGYKALITDEAGLKLELYDQTRLHGEMKASVMIHSEAHVPELNGNFAGWGYDLPDLLLAAKPATDNPLITVYRGSGQIPSGSTGSNGFYLTDGKTSELVYSVEGFTRKAYAEPGKSFFDKNGLTLQTRLKASIHTLNPRNLELDAGTIRINRKGLTTLNQKPFTVMMGNWRLNCDKWAITYDGIMVSEATLSAGADIKIENIRFTSEAMLTDKSTIHLDRMKLLGVREIMINTTKKGLRYGYLHSGVNGWSLYATPDDGETTVATLSDMPGLAPGDKIQFTAVDFNSEGESMLLLNSRKFRLFNIVDFTPYPSTRMYVYESSVKLKGNFDFGIPGYVRPSGAMGYFREGNRLEFAMMDMDVFRFTHHNVIYDLTEEYRLSEGLFTARGTVREPGHLPSLKVTMSHRATETRVDFDKGQKLDMGSGRELANLVGNNRVINNAWDVLRFEGDVRGFNNINPGQKMNFEVRGTVQAAGQQIAVSDIPSFPGLTMTYDLPNARLIGSAALNMNLGGLKLDGNINTVMDSQ